MRNTDCAADFAREFDRVSSYPRLASNMALLVAADFGLDLAESFGYAATLALLERRLIKTNVVLESSEGAFFEFEDRHHKLRRGFPGWVMPVIETPAWGCGTDDGDGPEAVVDLVAFFVDGPHKGRTLRRTGACDVLGWQAPSSRVLDVYTSPHRWLMNWLRQCRETPKHLYCVETGPEAFGALVLNPRAVDWSPWRVERASDVTSRLLELHFDSTELRDQVQREIALPPRKMPRLRALKRSAVA